MAKTKRVNFFLKHSVHAYIHKFITHNSQAQLESEMQTVARWR